MSEGRDRLQTSKQEALFALYKRITQARQTETMRITDLIEQALYEAESEETMDALVSLAIKVLKP